MTRFPTLLPTSHSPARFRVRWVIGLDLRRGLRCAAALGMLACSPPSYIVTPSEGQGGTPGDQGLANVGTANPDPAATDPASGGETALVAGGEGAGWPSTAEGGRSAGSTNSVAGAGVGQLGTAVATGGTAGFATRIAGAGQVGYSTAVAFGGMAGSVALVTRGGQVGTTATAAAGGTAGSASTFQKGGAGAGAAGEPAGSGAAGSPCVGTCSAAVPYCGDGLVNRSGEVCDDGNAIGGDGCTATCAQIENGWVCPSPGQPCVNVALCGDGMVTGRESCDDGNPTSGDGCSSSCQLEAGYVCPVAGSLCRTRCGDKISLGNEQCDDGNLTSGDGCDPLCRLESGYQCDRGGLCQKSVCGNGTVEEAEQCDDTPVGTSDLPFDGCYRCMVEPNCIMGTCHSPCGDGQRFSDEECDDGNLVNGDGCSSNCKIERGFTCTDSATAVPASTKTLPVVVRDFIGLGRQASPGPTNTHYHPDFNRHCGIGDPSITSEVKPTLDSNGKPAWHWLPYKPADITNSTSPETTTIPTPLADCSCDESAPESSWLSASETWTAGNEGAPITLTYSRPPCHCTNGASCTCDNPGHLFKEPCFQGSNRRQLSTPANLAQWYRSVDGVNLLYPFSLTLSLSDAQSGTYSNIKSTQATVFDPISTEGWIATGAETPSGCGSDGAQNASFTTETHFWFEYRGGEQFSFTGDDDTWVFLNNTLVVDLGGLHNEEAGSFTLDASRGTAVSLNCGYYYDGTRFSRTSGSAIPLGLVLGKTYEVAMFQAERNQCGSNFGVSLTNFSKPPSTCKSVCGDGIVATNEYCDDGRNTSLHNGCGPGCVPAPYCGDGQVQSDFEDCDDGLNVSQYGGCTSGCKRGPYCGDGRVQTPWEDCDDGSNLGQYGNCGPDCRYGARCGDGIVQVTFEQCDAGVANGQGSCHKDCTLAHTAP